MEKYSKKLFIEILALLILVNLAIIFFAKNLDENNEYLTYHIKADTVLTLETYYADTDKFSQSDVSLYNMEESEATATFQIPAGASYLRIDLGTQPAEIMISDIAIEFYGKTFAADLSVWERSIEAQQGIEKIELSPEGIYITTNHEDPYILCNMDDTGVNESIAEAGLQKQQHTRIFICILLDVIVLLVFFLFPDTFLTPFQVLRNGRLLIDLARNDFKTRYVGSYFGMIWAFIQPAVTILLYWFVFQVGLGAGPVDGHPFVIWLIAGLVPWMFFQDAVLYGTNALLEYSYLVKKVVFDVDILPMVKIISAFFVHVFFGGIAVLLFAFMGYFPGIYCIQIVYYSLCTAVFAIALVYCTSAVVLFFRDLSQLINIALQVGTWLTPIMWQIAVIPEGLKWIFKLNPMFYVVQGYRDSVISKIWFFERMNDTAYFWIVVIVLFVLGNNIFQRLKPHFPDVL